jgi:hypothetical protein
LAGANFGSISGSSSGATVNGGNFAFVGGLVGYNHVNASVSSSFSTGSVTAGTDSFVGGLAGISAGSIKDTYAIGPVTGGSSSTVGGLVGLLAGSDSCDGCTGSIATSWASGPVGAAANSSNVVTGGLVGVAVPGSSITNSFWDTYTTGQQFALGNNTNGGATAVTSDPSQAGASNYAFNKNIYAVSTGCDGTNGLDLGNTWFMVDGFTRPFLQSEWSSIITNPHQLQLIALHPNDSYVLGNAIMLGPALSNTSDMWGAAGFAPIAGGNGFNGTLLGRNFTIDGLTINSSAASLGLFGLIGEGGLVRDLNLTNVNITATSGEQTVGALAATNDGRVVNVNVLSGTLNGPSYGMTLGGLIGFNAPTGVIRGSSANVTARSAMATAMGAGTISADSSARTASSSAKRPRWWAGLVGQNDGNIVNSQSVATVKASGESDSSISASFGGAVG